MATPQLYDDDREKNLPPPISGALPQAVARKNARRGGTPNAPEVDDEAAPASNNGSALPQAPAQPNPPTIAAVPNGGWNRGGATGQWEDAEPGSMPYLQSVGKAFGAIGNLASSAAQLPTNLAGRALGVPSYAAQVATPAPAVNTQPSPAVTPATTPPDISTLPQATYSNEGRAPTPVPATANAAPAAPPAVASNLPPGITRIGNSYTGTNAGMGGGAIAAPAMTTEQANQFYGAQRQAMDAKAEQDLAENRARSMETTNKGAAAYQADQIRHGTELFHARNVLAQGGLIGAGGAAATVRDLSGQAGELEKFARAPSAVAPRNYIGEQAGQAAAVQTQQQNALMNPLHVQQLQQGLAAGGTAQKIAELTLEGHKTEQEIRSKLAAATDPEERMALQNSLLAMAGKPPHEPWKLHAESGRTDPISGTYQPGYAIAIHGGTGETRSITSDVTPQPIKPEAKFPKGERRTMNGITKEFDGTNWVEVKPGS